MARLGDLMILYLLGMDDFNETECRNIGHSVLVVGKKKMAAVYYADLPRNTVR